MRRFFVPLPDSAFSPGTEQTRREVEADAWAAADSVVKGIKVE